MARSERKQLQTPAVKALSLASLACLHVNHCCPTWPDELKRCPQINKWMSKEWFNSKYWYFLFSFSWLTNFLNRVLSCGWFIQPLHLWQSSQLLQLHSVNARRLNLRDVSITEDKQKKPPLDSPVPFLLPLCFYSHSDLIPSLLCLTLRNYQRCCVIIGGLISHAVGGVAEVSAGAHK